MQPILPALPKLQRKRRIISHDNDDSDSGSEQVEVTLPPVPMQRLPPVVENRSPAPKARRGRPKKIRNVEIIPADCDAEYTLNKKMRRKITYGTFILTMPVSDFGVIQRHFECIPEDKLMTLKSEDVYLDIKTALYNIMTNENEEVSLPSKLEVYIQKVHSYFSLRKTKANFIKEYTHAKDENEPRWAQRNLAKERNRTYIHAQHLGNALTMKGLEEFRDQYIDDKTTSILEEGSQIQVSARTQKDATTPITPISETATDTICVIK